MRTLFWKIVYRQVKNLRIVQKTDCIKTNPVSAGWKPAGSPAAYREPIFKTDEISALFLWLLAIPPVLFCQKAAAAAWRRRKSSSRQPGRKPVWGLLTESEFHQIVTIKIGNFGWNPLLFVSLYIDIQPNLYYNLSHEFHGLSAARKHLSRGAKEGYLWSLPGAK